MIKYLIFVLFLSANGLKAQNFQPTANVRLSFLLLPFSPLLTVEVRTLDKVTLQLESNFVNTHGANLKYFLNKRMENGYVFVGTAFVRSTYLRKDKATTLLPYVGCGYAQRFGADKRWTFDSRIGLGRTINADKNGIYPIIKTGVGRIF